VLEFLGPNLIKLFFVINPHIVVPFFLSLTQHYTNAERRATAAKMCVYGLGLGLLFIFCGNGLLNMLGVTLPAFRICGGFLLGVSGYGLLYSKDDGGASNAEGGVRNDVSLCPLAFPMFVGPATLTTLVGMVQDAKGIGGGADFMVIFAFIMIVALTYVLNLCGNGFVRILGRSGLMLLGKIGGILIMAIAVQMVVGGAKAFFCEQPVAAAQVTQATQDAAAVDGE
jgi:multiple antibiotic resistance protein